MDEKMARNNRNRNTFLLELLGSLIFLGVIFSLSGRLFIGGSIVNTSAGLLTPLLYAAGVLGAVSLLVISLASLSGLENAHKAAKKAAVVSAFSLLALVSTSGNPLLLSAVIAGFIAGTTGALSEIGI